MTTTIDSTRINKKKKEANMKDLHYYKFVSYSDGSGYCHRLRIKCMTAERAEHLRQGGIIYELMC